MIFIKGRAVLARAPVFDIERIEVMKGTQSIMFGKNATAGAINTTTKSATSGTEGFISLGIGSLNEKNSKVLLIPTLVIIGLPVSLF